MWVRGAPYWANPIIPDPGLQFGPFKVYVRTDGRWIVVDTRNRFDSNFALGPFRDALGAVEGAKRLLALEEQKPAAKTAAKVAFVPEARVALPPVPPLEELEGEPRCVHWWNPLHPDMATIAHPEYFRRCHRRATYSGCGGELQCETHRCPCARRIEEAAE